MLKVSVALKSRLLGLSVAEARTPLRDIGILDEVRQRCTGIRVA
jgi:hypothetical protein